MLHLGREHERLAQHPNIMGVKEASANVAFAASIAHLLGPEFRMFSGEDGIAVPLMSLGASGVNPGLGECAARARA